jgi:hypothetical protein
LTEFTKFWDVSRIAILSCTLTKTVNSFLRLAALVMLTTIPVLPYEILSSSPPNTINLAPNDDPPTHESSISEQQSQATTDPPSPGYNEIVNGFADGSSDWFETSQLSVMSRVKNPSNLISGNQSWVIVSSIIFAFSGCYLGFCTWFSNAGLRHIANIL